MGFVAKLVTPGPQASGTVVQGMFLGEPHGGMDLMADSGDDTGGFANPGFRRRHGVKSMGRDDSPCRELGGGTGGGHLTGGHGELLLNGLKLANRPSELLPFIGVLHRKFQNPAHCSGHLQGAKQRSPEQQRRLILGIGGKIGRADLMIDQAHTVPWFPAQADILMPFQIGGG